MSPHRSGPLAYWHSGGGVESRSGPLSRSRALELLRFYIREAIAALDQGNVAAAIFCTQAALEIASAIAAAGAWRTASVAPPVRVSHENAAIWLRKR